MSILLHVKYALVCSLYARLLFYCTYGNKVTSDRSLVNWEEFVCCRVRANETYSEAKHQFSVRNIDVLMNVQSPHQWWSTLKSAVFGSSSSLPPFFGPGGGLECESVGKADLLSNHFDSKAVQGVC